MAEYTKLKQNQICKHVLQAQYVSYVYVCEGGSVVLVFIYGCEAFCFVHIDDWAKRISKHPHYGNIEIFLK